MAYGSADTHCLALVTAFLADGWRVIYRPHPLSGVRDARYGEADLEIRTLVEHARATGGQHRVDLGVPVARSFADSDLLVCDVSVLAVDWLAVDRPLLMTRPSRPAVTVARTRLTELVPAISTTQVSEVAELARTQIDDDPLAAARHAVVEYYLGDIRPGVATTRFVTAVEHLMDVHAREQARLAAVRAQAG